VAVAPETWVTIVAAFEKDKLGDGADAAVWVDGSIGCVVDCGGEKLERFPASPVIGASLSQTSGFLRGAISELAVVHWKDGGPEGPGACGPGSLFSLSFETAAAQSFRADCPATLMLTLGSSGVASADDPQVIPCP
jgi:hypothetical protein